MYLLPISAFSLSHFFFSFGILILFSIFITAVVSFTCIFVNMVNYQKTIWHHLVTRAFPSKGSEKNTFFCLTHSGSLQASQHAWSSSLPPTLTRRPEQSEETIVCSLQINAQMSITIGLGVINCRARQQASKCSPCWPIPWSKSSKILQQRPVSMSRLVLALPLSAETSLQSCYRLCFTFLD